MKVSVSQLARTINSRFEHLLADLDEAIILSGKKTAHMKMLEDSEQFEARRELLLVEEVANRAREEQADITKGHLKQVEAEFHQRYITDLRKHFEDPEYLLNEVLGIHPSVGKLLDVLYTEACSISRLESAMAELDWLSASLIAFVRQPRYRRVDSSGSPIIINSTRGALGFVGVESLRILLPALIAKRSLPPKSPHFPQLVKHLWEYSLGSGKACQAVAQKEGIKWYLGYNIGLMSTLGRSAIAKLYIKQFDHHLQQMIIDQRKKNNPNKAKLLAELKPNTTYLIALWKKYASQINSDIVAHLKCRWLTVGIGLEDYARIKEISIKSVDDAKLHPLARLLFQCQGYMQFKMMKNHGLLSKNASMLYLRNFGIKSEDVVLLTKVNLTGLEIKIKEAESKE